MIAKIWKKVCVMILIIACLFNIIFKLVNKLSFNTEVLSSAKYMYEEYKRENRDQNTIIK